MGGGLKKGEGLSGNIGTFIYREGTLPECFFQPFISFPKYFSRAV